MQATVHFLLTGICLAVPRVAPVSIASPPSPRWRAAPPREALAGEGTVLWIRADELVVAPGEVLEGGCVIVENGRITRVGRELEPPQGATVIEGRVVCSAFIDPWSGLAIDPASLSDDNTSASTRSVDAFDPFLAEHLRAEAVRAGVTVARVQCGDRSALGGLGAVVRLAPGLAREQAVLLDESVLGSALGVSRRGRTADLVERIEQAEKLADQLDSGRKYREDWLEYEDELAEWQEAIAAKEKELADDFKKAKKDREKDIAEAQEKGKEFKEKRYKEDKKPKKPKYDPDREVMARAADGLLPTIVQVQRYAALRVLLDLTEDFDRVRLVVAGATQSPALAERLAARRIPVIVFPAPLGRTNAETTEGHDLALAARLARAGVEVLIGGGGEAGATRDLPLLAALAVGHGLDREQAFDALTLRAARVLDVADRLGSIEVGKEAELLVLDGEPLVGTTSVRWVVSAGQVVVSPEN